LLANVHNCLKNTGLIVKQHRLIDPDCTEPLAGLSDLLGRVYLDRGVALTCLGDKEPGMVLLVIPD
jgi:hypothetical protein